MQHQPWDEQQKLQTEFLQKKLKKIKNLGSTKNENENQKT
jgi:hypothetical protein